MKKVRFESPTKGFRPSRMSDTECHSPRPFVERHTLFAPLHLTTYPRLLPYSNDPIQKFECSNSSPYPFVKKTQLLSEDRPNWSPSNELDLSMLDASYHEPRRPMICRSILKAAENSAPDVNRKTPVLTSIGNKSVPPPNILSDNDFFIRRGTTSLNLNADPIHSHLNKLSLDKENDPLLKKVEIMKSITGSENKEHNQIPTVTKNSGNHCACHNCTENVMKMMSKCSQHEIHQNNAMLYDPEYTGHNHRNNHCHCTVPPQPNKCLCCEKTLQPRQTSTKLCSCTSQTQYPGLKMNAVDKKTWAIEKYEQDKNTNSMEVEKQTNVKEKREPTVSDLFKIIKLQNEQLQMLQEKVDKFILSSETHKQSLPIQNCSSERMTIETMGNEQHKISIGVMTSFEMVRTSTIVNKELLKSSDTQIQCNRSQISIKEVISKTPSSNFLDGIAPVAEIAQGHTQKDENVANNMKSVCDGIEDKTYNELSLYNVHVDTTTPLISPEQSLYLDLRDYSDSDADSDDQSNVGWTYYNKVMTHVNGMLQDSDMPSSASALYRNTRQQMQTVQMQIDKANFSVMKRVKFGDDPLGVHQPHIYAAADTSLKMNQLAAKYLKNGPVAVPTRPAPRAIVGPNDMSFATRNYMEKHNLLQGVHTYSKAPQSFEMPRFLDITALKQQPKLL